MPWEANPVSRRIQHISLNSKYLDTMWISGNINVFLFFPSSYYHGDGPRKGRKKIKAKTQPHLRPALATWLDPVLRQHPPSSEFLEFSFDLELKLEFQLA